MELREKLKYGDIRRISEITGMSYDMAKSVIQGRRENPYIKAVAAELLRNREELALKIRKQSV